jgi:hypothetical protein
MYLTLSLNPHPSPSALTSLSLSLSFHPLKSVYILTHIYLPTYLLTYLLRWLWKGLIYYITIAVALGTLLLMTYGVWRMPYGL